jgi:hypothetical protein
MPSRLTLRDSVVPVWRTSNRVTVFLVEHLPPDLWAAVVPGAPRRTVRMIAGHIHNARCMWIKTLGKVDPRSAGRSVCFCARVDSVRLGDPVAGLWKTVGLVVGIPLLVLIIACARGGDGPPCSRD